ncbi:MAG: hypothetical protein QXV37_01850, partial [Candidatus Jordarchaeaceae archaeon]
FPNGRRVLVFREEGNPSGWVSLNLTERLYLIPLKTLRKILPKACISSPVLVISDGRSTFRVIDPSSQVMQASLSFSETFYGCKTPKQDGSYDTFTILDQKKAVREALSPLVKAAIKNGQAASIGSLSDGSSLYIIVVNDEMVKASTIPGDPQAPNINLQRETSLLKKEQFLVVAVSPTGEILYPSPRTGRVPIIADSLFSWKDARGQPIVSPTITSEDERRKIIQALTDNALSFPSQKVEEFDFDKAWDRLTAELPPSLREYLRNTWFPAALNAKEAALSAANIEIREMVDLPLPVRKWIEAVSENQIGRLAAYEALKELPTQAKNLLRRAGLSWLRRKSKRQIEEILRRLYWSANKIVNSHKLEEKGGVFSEKNPALLAKLIQFIQTDNPTFQQLIGFLARERFYQILEDLGSRHFSLDLLKEEGGGVDYERIFKRAKLLLCPQKGLTHPEIVRRQTKVLDYYGVETPYETSYSRQLSEDLKAAGYHQEARIPWAAAEGWVEFPKEVREAVSNFIAALGLASAFVSSLLRDAEKLAQECGLRGEEYQKLINLAEMAKFILNWNVPPYLPRPTQKTPDLSMPLVFTRPDFCRTEHGGELGLVATELENSPGGLGIMQVLYPGYGCTSNLPSLFLQFMENTPLPRGINNNFSRAQLTILMTDDWFSYRRELEIFLRRMRELGINTAICSIEELVRKGAKISPGFVYHFAYPWNFFREGEEYFINLLLQPERVAELLGVPLERILIHNPEEAQKDMAHVMEDADYLFQQNLAVPRGFFATRLPGRVYRPDILQMVSQREEYFGKTLPQIGKEISNAMRKAAMEIYQRQGRDLYIFNAPGAGLFLYSKMGMALFHLPYFKIVFQTVLKKFGFSDQQAEEYAQLLQKMTAQTIPLIPPEKIRLKSLRQHVAHYLKAALAEPEKWMVKVSMDPYFGAYDWGSRGNFAGCDIEDERVWKAFINYALASNVPFVLQRFVPNVPFDQPRTSLTAAHIDGLGRNRIGIFHRDPRSHLFSPGDLVIMESASMRFTPFGLVHFGKRKGEVEVNVSGGIATLRPVPKDKKGKFVPVHGSTDAAVVPALFS